MESPMGSVHGQQRATQGVNHAYNSQWNSSGPPAVINSMAVFKEVKKAYEHRLEVINKVGGAKKLELTLETLRSWVNDLNAQNDLLVKAIEDLEMDATARILLERSQHQEAKSELRVEVSALRRRLARKDSDLRGLIEVLRRLREFDYCTLEGIHFFEPEKLKKANNCMKELKSMIETLQKENIAKEREIRRLNKDVQRYEQKIVNMRSEMSCTIQPEYPRKDAEVMVGRCFTELNDVAELPGFGSMLREEASKYQEKIRKMEQTLKSSGESVCALRKVNVALSEELHAMRRVCAALDEQVRAAGLRANFKDDIIREMRRQLKQAKAKLQECNGSDAKSQTETANEFKMAANSSSKLSARDTSATACVRQPRRASTVVCYQRDPPLHPESDDCHTPRLDGSGDDCITHRR